MGEVGQRWLLEVCRMAWNNERIPKDWENNLILPIHKKGDQTICDNYRAICLSSVGFKVYTKIVEKRLRQQVENHLEDEQAAFRPGRQTNDNMAILRNIMERAMENGEEWYLAFIDLRAAFDTIDRTQIWDSLRELQVNSKLIRVIQSIYRRVTARVQVRGQRSESLELEKGIKQGDSLSPLLFIITMDKLIKNTKTRTMGTIIGYRNLIPTKIDSLLYADDIVLIAKSRKHIQAQINLWTKEIENIGMEINANKTKIMIINETQTTEASRNITCKQQDLEIVTVFEYLGNVLTNDGKLDTEIAKRRQKASNIYHAINRTILKKREIEEKIKLAVYNVIALPAILYGCETWTTNESQKAQLNTIEMKFLRSIAGKTRYDRVRNEDIREITKQELIKTEMENRQLSWYGHIMRMDRNRLVKKVLETGRMGKRKRGRPRKTWIEEIEQIGKNRHKTIREMKEMTQDRRIWKNWIREHTTLPHPTL